MKRLYLIKWKDLGYKDCTWEKPEDFKDDAKIEEYHKLNDSPPAEPTVTQEDLHGQLAKSNFHFHPAEKVGVGMLIATYRNRGCRPDVDIFVSSCICRKEMRCRSWNFKSMHRSVLFISCSKFISKRA